MRAEKHLQIVNYLSKLLKEYKEFNNYTITSPKTNKFKNTK